MKMETNKIYNMDCLEGMKQLEDNSVDLIVTDPPYNISGLSQGIELHGKPVNIQHFGRWDYEFDPENFMKECKRILKLNGQIYIFTSDRLMGTYIDLLIKHKFHYRNTLVWFKSNLMPKIRHHTWRAGTEYILYAGQSKTEKMKDYTFNWLGQEEMKNLFIRPILSGKERIKGDDGKSAHPTQKPLDIVKKLIKVSSNEGDLVLDPFIGSGTTAVACIQTRRNFIGYEIDEKYYNIALKRIQSAKSQTKLPNGSFPNGEFNKDLTATQQVALPKSATQTSLNPDIPRQSPNFKFHSKALK